MNKPRSLEPPWELGVLELEELPLLVLFRGASMEMSVLLRSGLLGQHKCNTAPLMREMLFLLDDFAGVCIRVHPCVCVCACIPGPDEVSSSSGSEAGAVSRRVLPDQSRRDGGRPLRNLQTHKRTSDNKTHTCSGASELSFISQMYRYKLLVMTLLFYGS